MSSDSAASLLYLTYLLCYDLLDYLQRVNLPQLALFAKKRESQALPWNACLLSQNSRTTISARKISGKTRVNSCIQNLGYSVSKSLKAIGRLHTESFGHKRCLATLFSCKQSTLYSGENGIGNASADGRLASIRIVL